MRVPRMTPKSSRARKAVAKVAADPATAVSPTAVAPGTAPIEPDHVLDSDCDWSTPYFRNPASYPGGFFSG